MGKVLTKQLQAQLEANSAEMANNGASEDEIQKMAYSFVDQFGIDETSKKKGVAKPSRQSSLGSQSSTKNTPSPSVLPSSLGYGIDLNKAVRGEQDISAPRPTPSKSDKTYDAVNRRIETIKKKREAGIKLTPIEINFVRSGYEQINPKYKTLTDVQVEENVGQGLVDESATNLKEQVGKKRFAELQGRVDRGEVTPQDIENGIKIGAIPAFIDPNEASAIWNQNQKEVKFNVDDALAKNVANIQAKEQEYDNQILKLKEAKDLYYLKPNNFENSREQDQQILKWYDDEIGKLNFKKESTKRYLESLTDKVYEDNKHNILMSGANNVDKDENGIVTPKGIIELNRIYEDFSNNSDEATRYLLNRENNGKASTNSYVIDRLKQDVELTPRVDEKYNTLVDEYTQKLPAESKAFIRKIAGLEEGFEPRGIYKKGSGTNVQGEVSEFNSYKTIEFKHSIDKANQELNKAVASPQVQQEVGNELSLLQAKYDNGEINESEFRNERLKILGTNPNTRGLYDMYVGSVKNAQSNYQKGVNNFVKSKLPDYASVTTVDKDGNVKVAGMNATEFAQQMSNLQNAKAEAVGESVQELGNLYEKKGDKYLKKDLPMWGKLALNVGSFGMLPILDKAGESYSDFTDQEHIDMANWAYKNVDFGLDNMMEGAGKWMADKTGLDFFDKAWLGAKASSSKSGLLQESKFGKRNLNASLDDPLSYLNPYFIIGQTAQSAPYSIPAIATGGIVGSLAEGALIGAGLSEGTGLAVSLTRAGRVLQKVIGGSAGGMTDAMQTMMANYNDLIKEGYSVDDANKIANETFFRELPMDVITSTLQLEGLFRATVKPTIVNTLKRAGTTLGEGLVGGLQEAGQSHYLNVSKGDNTSFIQDFVENKFDVDFLAGLFGDVGNQVVTATFATAKNMYKWNQIYNISTSDLGTSMQYTGLRNLVSNPNPIQNQASLIALRSNLEQSQKEYLAIDDSDKQQKEKARISYRNALQANTYANEYHDQVLAGSDISDIHEDYKAHNLALAKSYQALADNANEKNKTSYQKQADYYTSIAQKAEFGKQQPIYAFVTEQGRVFVSESTAKTLAEGSIREKNDKFNEAVSSGAIIGINVVDDPETAKQLDAKFKEAEKKKVKPIISQEQGKKIDKSLTDDTQNTQTPSTESTTINGQASPNVGEASTTENAQPVSEAEVAVDGNITETKTEPIVEIDLAQQAQDNIQKLVPALSTKQKAEYIKEKRKGNGNQYLIENLYDSENKKWNVEGIDVVKQQAPAANQSEIELKNEGKAEAPTLENIDSRLRLGHPFYEKLSDALDKLGLIKKYNPETKEGDIVGGFSQKSGDGFQVGKIEFKGDGSISYIDGFNIIEFDKNGNVISENTKEVKVQETQNTIKSLKESIVNFENLRDSEAFKYKEVTQTDPLGGKTKVKVLKTEQELKASTDKINAQIEKSKAELKALEQQDAEVSNQSKIEAKKADRERRRQEGDNKDGSVYKSTTKEKDGLVITNYEAYKKEDGKKYSISGRKLTKEEFLSEYEVDEDYLDLLDGVELIVIREVRDNKGKLGITVRLRFEEGWIDAEIAAKYNAELTALEESEEESSSALKDVVKGTKVSDKEGNPVVVYHGSGRGGKNGGVIDKFDESMVSKNEIDFPVNGFFFAGRKGEAEIYGGEKNTGSYYIDIKNPASRADVEAAVNEARNHPDYDKEKGEFHNPTLVRKILIEKGFDGYIPIPFGKPNLVKLESGEVVKFDGKYFKYDKSKDEVLEFDDRDNAENLGSRDALDVMSLDEFKNEYSEKGIFIAFKPEQIHSAKAPTQYTEAATPKKETSGVSGSALKDVVRQESDAEKLNKEAGVDIYVARQDIDTNGGKYTLSQIKENGNTNTFLIEDAKGNEVGKAQLSANGNYLENIRIDEKHRRKGLASKVYDFIELRKGIELEPSPNKQSKEAKALWDKRNLQKSVSNKANGGLLAKALGESMSKTFADFRNKQQVLLELENKYFEQKGLSKEEFNKLSENEKSEIIKDAIKWKNDNPELVKSVEDLIGKAPTQYTEAAGGSALKDVEGKKADIEEDKFNREFSQAIDQLNNFFTNTLGLSIKFDGSGRRKLDDGKEVVTYEVTIYQNGKVIGNTGFKIVNGKIEISLTEINEELQGKGITSTLYQDINNALQQLGYDVLHSDTTFLEDSRKQETFLIVDGKELSLDETSEFLLSLEDPLEDLEKLKEEGRVQEIKKVKPGEKLWQSLERKGLAEKLENGQYRFINAKYDAEYIDKVKKGEFTKQQAKDALKEIGRLIPELEKQIDDAELKASEQQSIQENEGTTTTGATSEPIREKATSQGQVEKGVGETVQQSNARVGQVGATKSTPVLENTSRIQTSDAIRDAYGSLAPNEIQKLVDSGEVEAIPVSEDFNLYKLKTESSPNFKDYGGSVESATELYKKDKTNQEASGDSLAEQYRKMKAEQLARENDAKEQRPALEVKTLSGINELERENEIKKRKKQSELSESQKKETEVANMVSEFNSMRRNDKNRTDLLRKIRVKANEYGYDVNYTGTSISVKTKTEKNKNRDVKNFREFTPKSILDNGKPLFERSPEFQEAFRELIDLEIPFDIQNESDNSAYKPSQFNSALLDIENGIPSVQAERMLDVMEKAFESGVVEYGNKVMGYGSYPLSKAIEEAKQLRKEELFKDMSNEEIIAMYANEIEALNETDNILNDEYYENRKQELEGNLQQDGQGNTTPSNEGNQEVPISEQAKAKNENEGEVNLSISKPKQSITKEAFTALTTMLKKAFPKVEFIGEKEARDIMNGSDKPSYQITMPNGSKKEVQPINDDVVNGFYSPLEKTINETKFDKLPAKQWLDKFAKGEEAKWTGLTDWLAQQQGSVSKADIQQYLKDNRIQVVEVVKDSSDKDNSGEWQQVAITDHDNLTKFSKYQLEGQKENYKEVLVTMPNRIDKIKVNSIKEEIEFESKGYYIETDLSNGNNYAIKKENTKFKSSHFDEPNILVHLRMNTRVDAEGKKTLFLEEIQSDFNASYRKSQDMMLDYVNKNENEVIELYKKSGKLKVEC